LKWRTRTLGLVVVWLLLLLLLSACGQDPYEALPEEIREAVKDSFANPTNSFNRAHYAEAGPVRRVVLVKRDGDIYFVYLQHRKTDYYSATVFRLEEEKWTQLCQHWDTKALWQDLGSPADVRALNLPLEDEMIIVIYGWTDGSLERLRVVCQEMFSYVYDLPKKREYFCFVQHDAESEATRAFGEDAEGKPKSISFGRLDLGISLR